jgi:hypothetical protein
MKTQAEIRAALADAAEDNAQAWAAIGNIVERLRQLEARVLQLEDPPSPCRSERRQRPLPRRRPTPRRSAWSCSARGEA